MVGERLVSVILFGSVIKGGVTKAVSDFDMILIVDDSVTASQIRRLEATVSSIGNMHEIVGSSSKEFEGIPMFIMRESGMFMSCFICRETDFISGNFSKTFGANPLLVRLIVPSGIVFRSALGGSRTIYGKDLTSRMEMPPLSSLDIIRSLVMNELLALVSLFYHLFTENATKIAMEASKWSIYTASYLLTEESRSLSDSIVTLLERGIQTDHLQRLCTLRTEYKRDLPFAISTLKSIADIHFFLLRKRSTLAIFRSGED